MRVANDAAICPELALQLRLGLAGAAATWHSTAPSMHAHAAPRGNAMPTQPTFKQALRHRNIAPAHCHVQRSAACKRR